MSEPFDPPPSGGTFGQGCGDMGSGPLAKEASPRSVAVSPLAPRTR